MTTYTEEELNSPLTGPATHSLPANTAEVVEALKSELARYESMQKNWGQYIEIENQKEACMQRAHFGDGVIQCAIEMLDFQLNHQALRDRPIREVLDMLLAWKAEVFDDSTSIKGVWWRGEGPRSAQVFNDRAKNYRDNKVSEVYGKLRKLKDEK